MVSNTYLSLLHSYEKVPEIRYNLLRQVQFLNNMALASRRKQSQTKRQNYSPDALNENTSNWKAGKFTMRSRSQITLTRTTNLSKTNRKTISKIATGKQRNSSPLWTHFGFFVSSKRCQVVFSGSQKSASQNHALHACSWSAMTREWTKLTSHPRTPFDTMDTVHGSLHHVSIYIHHVGCQVR